MENLTVKLREELLVFANDRANQVEDISMDELVSLVVDGALWMRNNNSSK